MVFGKNVLFTKLFILIKTDGYGLEQKKNFLNCLKKYENN